MTRLFIEQPRQAGRPHNLQSRAVGERGGGERPKAMKSDRTSFILTGEMSEVSREPSLRKVVVNCEY